ncbi:MAG: hypothetical protein HFH50_03150 [Lachnospiraceae bacterium]|jgi:hypothetical protein|nr:hypothetical protein [Lachnospiraceae bacterium]
MRARSFWSEPAHYAIIISMLFVLILHFGRETVPIIIHVFYVVGILTANSISGYGIMLAVYGIYLINFKSIKKIQKAVILAFGMIIGMCIFIQSNDYLRGRLVNFLAFKDQSAVVKTVGGFQFLKEVPWYGVGIGNNANFYQNISQKSHLLYNNSGEFHNNILLAIITMGYVGALGFLLYENNVLKKSKKVF